ncbi:MAG: thiamine-phosphate kinase, partial [Lysobacteraceae bacterium]
MRAPSPEFDLIARIRTRAASRDDVVLGIGDDAAILRLPPGRDLVVAMDTLNAGVHFPDETAPADIGWKALAVNLSDLAAMAATPAWCTLSLSLPASDAAWVDAFLDGFLDLASRHAVALVGGDTTRGPLSVCVAVHGLVEPRGALRRSDACVGDDGWVTGTLGDAAAALRQWQAGDAHDPALRMRLDRPTPRVAAGRALAGGAQACLDGSDGLLADLAHVCRP